MVEWSCSSRNVLTRRFGVKTVPVRIGKCASQHLSDRHSVFQVPAMSELQLVLEIEKYPCLYNTQLPEYLRKEVTEKCWKVIAEKRGLTIEECKEKWRNIRSAFSRSLKPGGKPKRPYYLTEHLQFIMPFIKTRNKIDNGTSLLNLDDEQPPHDPEMNNDDDDEDDDDEDYEYPTADNFQNEVAEKVEPAANRSFYNNTYENSTSRPRKVRIRMLPIWTELLRLT